MKNERQAKILEIIEQQDIETQEQMLLALAQAGIQATQATISRDIKQLRLVKRAAPNGAVRYEVSNAAEAPEVNSKLEAIFRECITQCSCAQNIVVIKTLPGLASAACSAIDKMRHSDVVGSLAGDDTSFIAMRNNASADALCYEIQSMLK